ncbi:MAG: helix-turn-helix transcriptional regulator [Clostridiales bacterium]|nr:helix-turn-helix transcriptional regulator [Clostridiales bacterium]
MSINTIVTRLREEMDMTQKELAKRLQIDTAVMNRIELGTRPLRDDEITKLAEIFGVSTDYLLGRTNDRHRPYHELGAKDIKEIDTLMEDLENQMDIGISFHGEPLDEQDREVLMQSIRTAIEINKQRAKEKYTPKKYRGDK